MGLATIDPHSLKEHSEIHKIPKFGVNRPNSMQETAIWKCQILYKGMYGLPDSCPAACHLDERNFRISSTWGSLKKVCLNFSSFESIFHGYLTYMVPTQKIEFYHETWFALKRASTGVITMIFFTTAWIIDFFTFLLDKSCESAIKLTYVYAREVCEFRVS